MHFVREYYGDATCLRIRFDIFGKNCGDNGGE